MIDLGKNMNIKWPNGRCWVQFLTVFISRGISKLADLSLLPGHPFSVHRSILISITITSIYASSRKIEYS